MMITSCSPISNQTPMPTLKTHCSFENDTWLIVDRMLINKADGSVCMMETDTEAKIRGIDASFFRYSYVYKYEFDINSLKEYTFLCHSDYSLSDSEFLFYDCVITYAYDGKETDRECIREVWSTEEMEDIRKANNAVTYDFPYKVQNGYGFIHNKYNSEYDQAILDFVKKHYNIQDDTDTSTVIGLAKPLGKEIWFSTVMSDYRDSLRNDPTIGGIHRSDIISYNPETNEFNTIYEYNKKGIQIIDFDENGIYIFDSNGNFCYYAYDSKEYSVIHQFPNTPNSVRDFIITDKYICVVYISDGYTYFVYEKGGSVIACASY